MLLIPNPDVAGVTSPQCFKWVDSGLTATAKLALGVLLVMQKNCSLSESRRVCSKHACMQAIAACNP
jgi:hypothetical protein